jgi:hypothetical protein
MISIIGFSAALTFMLAVILKVHRRIRYGHIYEALGLNSLLNIQEDKVLSDSLLAKIEQKQRLGFDV